jgi:hypothetical protein
VVDVFFPGSPDEIRQMVPWCLEICDAGPCPGNTSGVSSYQGGHPAAWDPGLPIAACWHIAYSALCPQSAFAEFRLSRRDVVPGNHLTEVTCRFLAEAEACCRDGVDNDGDCLTDFADPDCNAE